LHTEDPRDFWVIGHTNEGSICVVAQGKANFDETVGFEYALPNSFVCAVGPSKEGEGEAAPDTHLEMQVFHRGCNVTPTTTAPLLVKCIPKGTTLPAVKMSGEDRRFIFDLNEALLLQKFNAWTEVEYIRDFKNGKREYYVAEDGLVKVKGFLQFVIYTDKDQVDKISEALNHSMHGFSLRVTGESKVVRVYRLLGAMTWVPLQKRICTLL